MTETDRQAPADASANPEAQAGSGVARARANAPGIEISPSNSPVRGAPSIRGSAWQLVNTTVPLLVLWSAAYLSLHVSYWLVLALAIPTAGLVVRTFIIQHDCGHGSFLPSRLGNRLVGRLCSLVTFTPFASWRRQHNLHHGNWNNLDRRQSGLDIYSTCLTVAEYRKLPRWARFRFRLLQNPLVALVLFPPLIFILLYRIPFDTPRSWRNERRSVWLTNAALLALYSALGALLGFREVALVQLPVIGIAGIFGVWLFSLQHRFKQAVWMRGDIWEAGAASLEGSSFLKLPGLLQWFTGNIGYHHVHHLDSRVPNYRLKEWHCANPQASAVRSMSLLEGLSAWRYALWDEAAGKMVRIADLAPDRALAAG